MGSWVGIKRALNSTLGTGHFRPLNEIITNQLRASNNLYMNIESAGSREYEKKGEDYVYKKKWKSYTNGSVNIHIRKTTNGDRQVDLIITKTDAKGTVTTETATKLYPQTELYYTVFISAGDVLSFVDVGGNDIYYPGISICADEVPSLGEILDA